jgi:hypothetical protein
MLNVNRADVEQMVKIIDYILDNEDKVTVEQLMADCGLTFEEYRLMSALSMPAIRKKNEYKGAKVRAMYYKTAYAKEKAEREKLDEMLMMANGWLDRRFRNKVEKEVVPDGYGDDFDGNDEEPADADR